MSAHGTALRRDDTDTKTKAQKVLQTLLTEHGIFASGDKLYKNAVFGRDSLEVAEDLLATQPSITRTVLRTLARLQGTSVDALTEEEPGRIHHEHRALSLGTTQGDPDSEQILRLLAAKWGGSQSGLTYYGSVDATPLFVRVLAEYCAAHGNEFLSESVTAKDGRRITMQDAMLAALGWLERKIYDSPLGLVEFNRTNPDGIRNQVWKDSEEFYVHTDGCFVTSAVASIEVQGLVYDALCAGARHFPEQKDHYLALAANIQGHVLGSMWLKEDAYFALGYSYDTEGVPKLIRTCTANPAELLDTTIFDNLPELNKEQYLRALVTKVFSAEFLTHAGVRSRSLAHAKVVEFWDYHGTFVTWPKETYDIAKGLRRQGFTGLAEELEDRLHNVCDLTGQYPEFVYVDETGKLLLHSEQSEPDNNVVIIGHNIPETIQAWTVSALAGIEDRPEATPTAAQPWQTDLESTIRAIIPHFHRHPGALLTSTYQLVRPATPRFYE